MGFHYDSFGELEKAAYKSAGAQGKRWNLLNEHEKKAIDSFCCSNIDSCSEACRADPGAQKYVNRNNERYNTYEKRQEAGRREFLDNVDAGSAWKDWGMGGAGADLGTGTGAEDEEEESDRTREDDPEPEEPEPEENDTQDTDPAPDQDGDKQGEDDEVGEGEPEPAESNPNLVKGLGEDAAKAGETASKAAEVAEAAEGAAAAAEAAAATTETVAVAAEGGSVILPFLLVTIALFILISVVWALYAKFGSPAEAQPEYTAPTEVLEYCKKDYGFYSTSEAMKLFGSSSSEVSKQLVIVPFPTNNGTILVHKKAAPCFEQVGKEITASGIKYTMINGGTFNWRQKAGGGSQSMHSFGIALDINVGANPWQGGTPGNCKTDVPKGVVDIFHKYGFSWGGEWNSVCDAMHFEWHGAKP